MKSVPAVAHPLAVVLVKTAEEAATHPVEMACRLPCPSIAPRAQRS
ncbi:MAG: hypothetical protein U0802_07700 [Candidatus Binatia bacterium]